MPKDLSGTLRPNQNKTSEKHPALKGHCNINGTEYWIAAWSNTGDDGQKYLSLKFEQKAEKTKPGPKDALSMIEKLRLEKTGGKAQDLDDDIPW